MEVEKRARSKPPDKTGQGQPHAGPLAAPGGPRRMWGEAVGSRARTGDQVVP